MPILNWYNGEEWVPLYVSSMQSIDEKINAIESAIVTLPESEYVNEDVMVPLINQETAVVESGTGTFKHSQQEKAFKIPTTARVGDTIKKLAEYAHTHKVVATNETLVNQCACQCDCQCQCDCNCLTNCCTHCTYTVPCTYDTRCQCNCDCFSGGK